MDYISDESSDISDSEIDDFESQTYLHLKVGNVRVKRAGNTYRCPFCVGKKKLVYNYKDLLQHAMGVGASNRGGKVKAKHRALAKLLKNDFADTVSPSLQLEVVEQQPSLMAQQDDQFVWPWMGILVNVREGGSRLKERLIRFHPSKIIPLWGVNHLTGAAVVEFSKDWIGFKSAMAFENHLKARNSGKRDWLETDIRGLDIFGWVARADDYKFEDAIGEHLRKRGDLKSVVDLAMEETHKMNKLVAYLSNQIDHKNEVMKELESQYHQTRVSLEKISLIHQAYNEASVPEEQLQNAEQGVLCQICDRPNHSAKHCQYRFDQTYQPEGISESMAAMSLSNNHHRTGTQLTADPGIRGSCSS